VLVVRVVHAVLAAVAASGCHGCHDDHPYVPYTIGVPETGTEASAETMTSAKGLPASADAGRAAFSGEPAMVAPPGLSRWSVDGTTLEAP
jgi:hypothetical protein